MVVVASIYAYSAVVMWIRKYIEAAGEVLARACTLYGSTQVRRHLPNLPLNQPLHLLVLPCLHSVSLAASISELLALIEELSQVLLALLGTVIGI